MNSKFRFMRVVSFRGIWTWCMYVVKILKKWRNVVPAAYGIYIILEDCIWGFTRIVVNYMDLIKI